MLFLGGCALPVVLYLTFQGTPSQWAESAASVFIAPRRRLQHAAMEFPSAGYAAAAVPYALFLLRNQSDREDRDFGTWAAVLTGLLMALPISALQVGPVYRLFWNGARALGALVVAVGCLLLWRDRHAAPAARKRVFLLLVTTAFFGLVQYPFAAPIYFCYTAPLVVVTLLAIISSFGTRRSWLHPVVLAACALFAVSSLNRGYVFNLGRFHEVERFEHPLGLARAGLLVFEKDRSAYRGVVAAIHARRRGPYIYAAPDCPEIYFLSGSRNPTRSLFEFLGDGDYATLRARLTEVGASVAVINAAPHFSGALPDETVAALRREFPEWSRIGRFEVRWRR
jgi:hypothetical protein